MTEITARHLEQEAAHPLSKLLRNVKGIIFDFDGTLFDNIRFAFYLIAAHPTDILRVWKERLVRKSLAGCDYFSADAYHRVFFSALGKACRRSPDQMRAWYFNNYMQRMTRVLKKHYKLRPGVAELLRNESKDQGDSGENFFFRAFPKLGIYSDYPLLKERMEALGLKTGPNITLYGPESFGAQKPAVRPFLQIAGDFGVKPDEVLVIGDREETDGLGAFNAGMHFFCIETGHRRYYRLDPYRRPPDKKPNGPSLLMHAGPWGDLLGILQNHSNSFKR